MTPWLWMVAIGIGAALFALGYWIRAVTGPCAQPGHRAEAVFGAVLIVMSMAIAANTIHFQITTSKQVSNQVACNTRLIDSEAALAEQRRAVDAAAIDYDLAEHEWAEVFTTSPLAPADDPRYLKKQRTSAALIAARVRMIQAYADHPLKPCHA